jgi:hypothetical protein
VPRGGASVKIFFELSSQRAILCRRRGCGEAIESILVFEIKPYFSLDIPKVQKYYYFSLEKWAGSTPRLA